MNKSIRADHVGSLLRPKDLLNARDAYDAGKISTEELQAAEDKAVLHALALQRDAGIDVFTDGEFRRLSWLGGLPERLEGIRPGKPRLLPPGAWKGVGEKEANADIPITAYELVGKIRMNGRFTDTATRFLEKHAPGPYKVTMPGPTMEMNTMFDPGSVKNVYESEQALLNDLVEIYKTEVKGQVADGAAYIQLDSLRYMQVIHGVEWTGRIRDKDAVLKQAIDAVLRQAKAGGAIAGVHMCRGNHRSAWSMSGSYDEIAERLFSEVEADRFLLEYDDERAGSFEPLRFLPKGKIMVLGLVSTKVGDLEDPDTLLKRVDEAAKFAPLDQLAISPQCGFASTYLGNLLTEDDEKRKLELVAKTARRIWG